MLKYYNILGVTRKSDLNAIKKAYRAKAMVLHPDKETGDEKLFRELNEAYEWLNSNHVQGEEVKQYTKNSVERVTLTMEWNLFDVFNGIDSVKNVKFGDKFVTVLVKEAPRDITYYYKPKYVRTNEGNFIVIVVNKILTTSNSSFQIRQEGMDLRLIVLVKTESQTIITPLKGIIINNGFPFMYQIDKMGLFYHTLDPKTDEPVTHFGNLIIDNSINTKEPEKLFFGVIWDKSHKFMKIFIAIVFFITLMLEYF